MDLRTYPCFLTIDGVTLLRSATDGTVNVLPIRALRVPFSCEVAFRLLQNVATPERVPRVPRCDVWYDTRALPAPALVPLLSWFGGWPGGPEILVPRLFFERVLQ